MSVLVLLSFFSLVSCTPHKTAEAAAGDATQRVADDVPSAPTEPASTTKSVEPSKVTSVSTETPVAADQASPVPPDELKTNEGDCLPDLIQAYVFAALNVERPEQDRGYIVKTFGGQAFHPKFPYGKIKIPGKSYNPDDYIYLKSFKVYVNPSDYSDYRVDIEYTQSNYNVLSLRNSMCSRHMDLRSTGASRGLHTNWVVYTDSDLGRIYAFNAARFASERYMKKAMPEETYEWTGLVDYALR